MTISATVVRCAVIFNCFRLRGVSVVTPLDGATSFNSSTELVQTKTDRLIADFLAPYGPV